MRKIRQLYLYETVSGSKDKFNLDKCLDSAGLAVVNAQFQIAISVVDHAIC